MVPERLSSLDASFLYLEKPSMHMHVAGVSILAPRADGPLMYEHVHEVVEARLDMAPRLRQRVLRVPYALARPLWVDDQNFDLDFHLRRSAIPTPGGRVELERAIGRVLSRPLDPSKPLWDGCALEAPPRTRRRDRQHADRLGALRPGPRRSHEPHEGAPMDTVAASVVRGPVP